MSRVQKTVRNLLLCALLWALVYTMLGFPPYTVRGMLDRVERQYLLSDLEPLLTVRESRKPNQFQLFGRHRTCLLARTGDTYVFTEWNRHFLETVHESRRELKMGQGVLAAAWKGTVYAAGPFEDAASAALEVTPELWKWGQVVKSKTFSLQGERLGDQVFGFSYPLDFSGRNFEEFDPEDLPEEELSLYAACYEWYLKSYEGGGAGLRHGDVPCVLTLYDAAGAELARYDLSLDNYEITWW